MPNFLRPSRLLLSLAAGLLLAACSIAPATSTPAPEPTPVTAPSIPLQALLPTLAATATATSTSTPSPTATPALPSDLGTLLLKESFGGNSGNWGVANGASGAISLFEDSLVIGLRQPQTSLVSLYAQPVPSNLYLQAMVDTSLCDAAKNEFGFVFRASPLYQYRAAFTCDGELRFERYHGRELEGASGWQSTQSLLTGAPAQNQIGLRVSGARFSFYANNQMTFSYVDTLLTSGQVGLFAGTAQSSLLTVAFKDFELWRLP
ncbi:MAG: hypothetical protein ABSG98_11220 [Anaerolineales bacterium]|jgi:hypothetical protein